MLIPGQNLNRAACSNLSFFQDGKIEAGLTTAQESLHNVRTAEPDAELEARHAGLRDEKLGGPDPKPVPDADLIFKHALGG